MFWQTKGSRNWLTFVKNGSHKYAEWGCFTPRDSVQTFNPEEMLLASSMVQNKTKLSWSKRLCKNQLLVTSPMMVVSFSQAKRKIIFLSEFIHGLLYYSSIVVHDISLCSSLRYFTYTNMKAFQSSLTSLFVANFQSGLMRIENLTLWRH